MTEKSPPPVSHRGAVERVRNAETFAVTLPVIGRFGCRDPSSSPITARWPALPHWRSSTGPLRWQSVRATHWPVITTTRSRRSSAKPSKTPSGRMTPDSLVGSDAEGVIQLKD
jgi:hypothetical protein